MKDQAPYAEHTFHATSVTSMESELLSLADRFLDMQVKKNLISRTKQRGKISVRPRLQVANWQMAWPGEIKRKSGALQELKYVLI